VILRLAAALSLLIGATGLLGYLYVVDRGPFATPAGRHLRAMKDRGTAPAVVTPITPREFLALPRHQPLAVYAPYELRGVSLEGWTQVVTAEPDLDDHLQLVFQPRSAVDEDVPYASVEMTPRWRRGSTTWRYEPLVAAVRARRGGIIDFIEGPRRVRVSGWLLYDYPYDLPTTATNLRLTGWEIHPITRLEIWDDSLQVWKDYRR